MKTNTTLFHLIFAACAFKETPLWYTALPLVIHNLDREINTI